MENLNLQIFCEEKHCKNRGLKKFYAVLDKKVQLEGNWEVGISEISFTKSFFNIKEKQNVDIMLPYTNDYPDEYRFFKPRYFVEPGDYTIEGLIARINLILKTAFHDCCRYDDGDYYYWDYDEKVFAMEMPSVYLEKNKVIFKSGKARQHNSKQLFFIYPSEFLCDMLGYDRNELFIDYSNICHKYKKIHRVENNEIEQIFQNDRLVYAKYPYKIHQNYDHFFICSDICRPSNYGENFYQLLRHVDFKNLQIGSKKTIIYENPYYIKLRKNDFQMIEIKIMKNLNNYSETEILEEEFDFIFGELYLILNFRKIDSNQVEYEVDLPNKIEKQKKIDIFEVIKFNPEEGAPEIPKSRINP